MYRSPLTRPYNESTDTFKNWRDSIVYYLDQVFAGAWIKAAAATVTAIFLDFLHGDPDVLCIYLGFSLLDLILGRFTAKRLGLYDARKIMYWVKKQFTHFFLLAIVGLISHATLRTSGISFAAINWFLLILIYVEAASIEDKISLLGWPVHPIIHKLFGAMRRKAAHDFSVLLDNPSVREEIEQALCERLSKKVEDTQ